VHTNTAHTYTCTYACIYIHAIIPWRYNTLMYFVIPMYTC
jgi:hypothetical protein